MGLPLYPVNKLTEKSFHAEPRREENLQRLGLNQQPLCHKTTVLTIIPYLVPCIGPSKTHLIGLGPSILQKYFILTLGEC